jgi:hypothetical protein
MCRLPNIQVMGFGPVLAFCNTELNKLVTQKLRIKIICLSYHPLHPVDVFVHAVAVNRLLTQSVLLQHDSKLIGHPPAIEPVPGLQILNQSIDCSLKVLILSQINPFHLCGLHLLLQHLRVVCGNRYAAGMLEGVLDLLPCSIIEYEAAFSLANSIGERKYFCM